MAEYAFHTANFWASQSIKIFKVWFRYFLLVKYKWCIYSIFKFPGAENKLWLPKTVYESLPKCVRTQNFCSLFSYSDHSYIVTSSSGKGKEREKLDCSKIHEVYKRQRNTIQKTHRCLVQRCKIWEQSNISLKSPRWKGVLLPCFHTLVKVVFIFWFLLETLHLCLLYFIKFTTHTHITFFIFSDYIN